MPSAAQGREPRAALLPGERARWAKPRCGSKRAVSWSTRLLPLRGARRRLGPRKPNARGAIAGRRGRPRVSTPAGWYREAGSSIRFDLGGPCADRRAGPPNPGTMCDWGETTDRWIALATWLRARHRTRPR